MAGSTLNIKGHDYSFGKIGTLEQMHILRRFGSLMAELMQAFKTVNLLAMDADSIGKINPIEAIVPVFYSLAKMSNNRFNYILFGLLNAVNRKGPNGGWAPVNNGYKFMFEDMEMDEVIQLAAKSLVENYARFFATAGLNLPEGILKAKGQ